MEKIKKKKQLQAIIQFMYAMYGDMFHTWWQIEGEKKFIAFAKSKGIEYADYKYDVDCADCFVTAMKKLKETSNA